MSPPPETAFEAADRLAECLEGAEIPYAIGGAISYGVWAPARGTLDVDLSVFLEGPALAAAAEAFRSLGIDCPTDELLRTSADGGLTVLWFGPFRVDVFTPNIPFFDEAQRTRIRVRRAGSPGDYWYLSAEALCVFKLLFFRSKDIPDLERVVGTQGRRLDTAYVRGWMADMMGEDDERVRKWDVIVAECLPAD